MTTRENGPVDEPALLARVVERDSEAFEQLYRAYYPRLFGYLFRILRRIETVEEVLNDVMLVVWNQAHRFRGDSRISTWIFGIAYRQAMKSIRRHRSQPTLLEPDDRLLAIESKDAERDTIEHELRLTLNAALEQLTPKHRAVVELTYYYGYSYPEIAAIVGCPENTVKTRMFHARRKLQTMVPELARLVNPTATETS
jgi:RNA polymerase sigma-70 factor (ECF subfamily)